MKKTILAAALLSSISLAYAAEDHTMSRDASGGYEQAMESMNKKMDAMKPSGDPDAHFAMMMSIHHQAAIEMAQTYVASGKDPKLKAMAEKMIADQKREISELKMWSTEKN
jgi:uncharacterized protein (DUF305 family)